MNAVDLIAQAIRVADGDHTMGAAALSEAIVAALNDAGYDLDADWEYGLSWLDGDERVYSLTEDEWHAGNALIRANTSYPYPEENYVARRRKAGPWQQAAS
jgi:hypothetical protein